MDQKGDTGATMKSTLRRKRAKVGGFKEVKKGFKERKTILQKTNRPALAKSSRKKKGGQPVRLQQTLESPIQGSTTMHIQESREKTGGGEPGARE